MMDAWVPSMNLRRKLPYAEWILGGIMFLLCVLLTVLQYRWTGEIARAEMVRLRGSLGEQARALTRAFDAEVTASTEQLLPPRSDFSTQPLEAVHIARFKAWKEGNPRPIFSRIGVAVAVGKEIQLSLFEQASGQLIRTNWPAEWLELRQNLADKITIGSPPFNDAHGMLIEFPIFGGTPDTRREHWVITELDSDYARRVWLPGLVAQYLNPEGRVINDARVKVGKSAPTFLYQTQTNASPPAQEFVSASFNQRARLSRTGPASPPGSGWVLEAWQRPGVLEAAVSRSRARNLGIAIVINVLMFATGVALLRQTRRSRQLAEQQMNFVANVSHELRTPLTVIRGAAHNLKRGVVHEPGQIAQYSSLILEHSDQLGEMLEQLLALAGTRKDQSAPLREPVRLAEILNEAVAATTHDTQIAQCEVRVELPPSLPTVTGDAAALRRVFQNLVTNAAKHGGQGHWIGITAARDEDSHPPMVEVQVADRGPGIPASEQENVFKPFFRGARAQTDQIRGAGLGLSLVKEIVEAHNGTVSLRSTNGSGATFIVRLPIARSIK